MGAPIGGPFTTDASGNWSGTIVPQSGPLLLEASGGSYTDEATGNPVTVPAGRWIDGILEGTASQVTPLTHATFSAIQALVGRGSSLAAATTAATATSTVAFGFDFGTTVPSAAAGATANQKKYAGLLGGLSTLLNANPALTAFNNTPPFDLVVGVATDMGDGKLDGLDATGAAVMVVTDAIGASIAPLPALSPIDLSAWLDAANTYCASKPVLNTITFNTGVLWNPSAGPGGNTGVAFTGAGAAVLPSTAFTATGSQIVNADLKWVDDPHHVEILIAPVPDQQAYPGKVQTLNVVYSGVAPSVVWERSVGTGIPGIVMSTGETRFTNTTATETTLGGTTITLNGTLNNPIHPLATARLKR